MSDALDMGFEFHHGIWDIDTAMDEHCFDATLSEYMVNVFAPPASTLDLGCGKGNYLQACHQAGWRNLLGVDGTPGLAEIAEFKNIITHDLCTPIKLQQRFDLVICLEVGEHLPQKYEGVLLNNIVQHANKDVLLSWAIEGQKGPGHINCQNNDYVIQQMKERGFKYNQRISDGLRDNASLSWFKNTLMYFQKATS